MTYYPDPTIPPPDGWIACDTHPHPGQTIMLWRPASSFKAGSWVPARIKDRRIRGGHSRDVLPPPGAGRAFPAHHRPAHHYATPAEGDCCRC